MAAGRGGLESRWTGLPTLVSMPLNVTIVGAGIGGLCLANGLCRAGVAVRGLERGGSRIPTAPYPPRLHPPRVRAPARCPPPDPFPALSAHRHPPHHSGPML